MNNVKEQIIDTINKLPDNTTWDDAIYALYLNSKLKKSKDDFKRGRILTLQELKEHIERLEEGTYN